MTWIKWKMEMPDCISKKMSSTDLEKDIVAMKVKQLQMLVFVTIHCLYKDGGVELL